jgi:guanylate kinase
MRNQNKITLCDYLANKVPNDCVDVLENSGHTFDKPRSKAELAELLKQYVSKDREKALKKLAEIHPDKELCQSIDRPVMDSDYKECMCIIIQMEICNA